MNEVIISGNLTRDPQKKSSQGGTSITSFTVACNEKIHQSGEEKDFTAFVDVTVFGPLADVCADALKKGTGVIVRGRYQTRSYMAADGTKKFSTSVIASEVGTKLFPAKTTAFSRFEMPF